MSILSGILGNYGDDMFRAASNQLDNAVINTAKNKLDDVALKSAKKAAKSTATQRKAISDFDEYISGFGKVGQKTRKQLLEDYAGGGKIWSKFKDMGIDRANLQDFSENANKTLGSVQRSLYDYADKAGILIDVGDLLKDGKENMFTTAQRKRLAASGIDLDKIIGSGSLTTSDAEKLYKSARTMGVNYRNAQDGTQKALGVQLGKFADSLKTRIDDTVSPISKSFGLKKQLSDALYGIGDSKRARQIAQMPDDDVAASLLRKEMQPYMVAKDLIGLEAPKQKNINIMGIDTGIKNPLPELGKKVGSIPLNIQAAMENGLGDNAKAVVAGGAGLLGGLLGASALGGGNNAAPASTSTLGSLMGGDAYGGMSGMGGLGGDMTAQTTYMNQAEPTLGGYSYDDLENAYVSAIMAGDSGAASVIADMIGMLDSKTKRSESSKSKSSGDEKAQAGLNTLKELYSLYQSFGGAQGVVKGNITNALNTVSGGSYNPAAATFDAVAQGSIGRIVKAMGDSGALSDSDKQNALKMIPKVSDSPALAEQKFQSLYELLLEAAQGE